MKRRLSGIGNRSSSLNTESTTVRFGSVFKKASSTYTTKVLRLESHLGVFVFSCSFFPDLKRGHSSDLWSFQFTNALCWNRNSNCVPHKRFSASLQPNVWEGLQNLFLLRLCGYQPNDFHFMPSIVFLHLTYEYWLDDLRVSFSFLLSSKLSQLSRDVPLL